MKGIIFNIEEFAVHDGPGIRKLVFFKGCPLKCSWCHNPEGISFHREIMVSRASCIDCGRCREICTQKECVLCGKCVDVCPLQLRRITGQEVRSEDLAQTLLQGKEVMIQSGGGITISGGEPLAQPEFLFDLMERLKPLSVAVETSGYAKPAIFQKVISKANLILMDIKHTDPEIHKRYTGVDNRLILENLKLLCSSDTGFYIRIPLIPGVNDTRENIEKTAHLIRSARHLQRVELLPYHLTAGAKYPMVNRRFEPGFEPGQKVNIWKDIFEKHHIKVTVL